MTNSQTDILLSDGIPLYIKVYQDLKKQILNYTLLPNEPLPSEQELCIRYNVSRQTIRNAAQLLAKEKLIVKNQGKPSYIRDFKAKAKNPSITLELGGINNPELPITKFHHLFAQKIEERTNGEIVVNVSCSSKLGSGNEQVLQVAKGQQAMFGAAVEWLEILNPDWGITSVPFLFNSLFELQQYVQSHINEEMKEMLIEDNNTRVLADNWYRPSRVLLSKKPCYKLHDIKDMRMSVPRIPSYKNAWEALGTVPIENQWGKEKKAFISNTIDMVDAPIDSVLDSKLHKIAPYVTITKHLFSRACIIINEEVFQSLSGEYQEILINTAEEIGNLFTTKIFENTRKEHKKLIDDHAVITSINTEAFQKVVEELLRNKQDYSDFPYAVYKYFSTRLKISGKAKIPTRYH